MMDDWQTLTGEDITARAEGLPLPDLVAAAGALRDAGKGAAVSYSRKVFIPLTKLCRDVCHYCTFAETPKPSPWPPRPTSMRFSRRRTS